MTKQKINNHNNNSNNDNNNNAVPADHRINLKESEKKYKYLDLARELKKTVEHESNDRDNFDWCVRHSN